MPTYTLVINGKPEGPFTIDELRARNIRPDDFVRTEGMVDYKEAKEVAELRQLFGFKKPPLLIQYYASFDQRLLAAALDWFIIAAVAIVVVFVGGMFIADKESLLVFCAGAASAIPFVKFIYAIIMESSAKQATLGKLMLKIRVCDMEGNRLSFIHAFGRNFAKLASVVTLFAGYFISFFDKQHQCLHDKMAGTLVIKDRLV